MGKKKVPDTVAEVKEAEAPKATVSKIDSTVLIVLDPRGNAHRTYSLEVHGEKYRELADEYVAARPGWSLK